MANGWRRRVSGTSGVEDGNHRDTETQRKHRFDELFDEAFPLCLRVPDSRHQQAGLRCVVARKNFELTA
ncbi:MAG: hypothetical protein J2P31_15450, partial [Blastocatellia bacterium]|nr:hypothetical protein [Blastocatellia bacterium]